MTSAERTAQIIADTLREMAPSREPDHLVQRILEAAAAAPRRPAWLAILYERSLRLGRGLSVGSAAARALAIAFAVIACTVLALGAFVMTGAPAPLVPAERGSFRMLPPMWADRESPSATVLSDGRVLVVGGYGSGEGSAELWDPVTEGFTRLAAQPVHARWGHAAVLLPDGRVLLVGGSTSVERQEADGTVIGTSEPVLEAETWDPVSGTFSASGTMEHALARIAAILQADGTVLVTGLGVPPATLVGGTPIAEIWDPTTGTFRPAPVPAAEAVAPGVWLRDGSRLFIEERLGDVWDPGSGSVLASGPSSSEHIWVPATLLADGRVLFAGGDGAMAHQCGTSAEIWDPATRSFAATGDLVVPRTGYAAALLPDGRVLIVGNWGAMLAPCPRRDSAEIFELR